jgi:rod shape-determining protein MreC
VLSFFSNKRLIFLMVSTILMVVIVGLTMQERAEPTWGEQFTRDGVGFFQSIVYKPAHYVEGLFETVGEIKEVYTENQRLKAHLQDNAQLSAKIRELESENESLRDMVEAEDDLSDYDLRAAEVISRSPDRWYQQITINRVAQLGIEPNMAVITADGLIGRVNGVSQFTSTVELISDANRSVQISAIVQGDDNIYGVIEGYDSEQEALFFRKIPKDVDIEEGQTVITSGLGGMFPRGLYVGEVLEVVPDEYGLEQSALVEPAANLYQLDYVYVVQRSMISEDEIELGDEEDENDEENDGDNDDEPDDDDEEGAVE